MGKEERCMSVAKVKMCELSGVFSSFGEIRMQVYYGEGNVSVIHAFEVTLEE